MHDDVQWTELGANCVEKLGANCVPTQIKPCFLFGNRIQVLDNFIRSWFLVGGQVGHIGIINRYQHIPGRNPMVMVLPGVDRSPNSPGRFVDRKMTAYGVRRHGHTIIPESGVFTPALLLLFHDAVLLVLIPLVPVRSVAVTGIVIVIVIAIAIAIVIVRLIIIPDDRRNKFIFILGGGGQRLLLRVVLVAVLLWCNYDWNTWYAREGC